MAIFKSSLTGEQIEEKLVNGVVGNRFQELTEAFKAQFRTNIGAGTYSKPDGGIAKTDLAADVQTSLGKADTAYQKPTSGVSKTDLSTDIQASLSKADSAYQKPSTGIQKTDLSQGVQDSLGKADTALQEHQSLAGYATEQWVEDKGYLAPTGTPADGDSPVWDAATGKAKWEKVSVEVDPTLSVEGKAADAKATGDRFKKIAERWLTSASGDVIEVTDSSDEPIRSLTIYGKSTQDGTPTPDSPVEIVDAVDPLTRIIGKTLYSDSVSRTLIKASARVLHLILPKQIPIKAGHLSVKLFGFSKVGTLYMSVQDASANVLGAVTFNDIGSGTFSVTSGTVYKLYFYIPSSGADTDTASWTGISVVLGDEIPTEIQPAETQTLRLPSTIGGQAWDKTLRRIPAPASATDFDYQDAAGNKWYADKLTVRSDGTGDMKRNIMHKVISSQSDIAQFSNTYIKTARGCKRIAPTGSGMLFSLTVPSASTTTIDNNGDQFIWSALTGHTSQAEARAWVDAHVPFTCMAVLAEPVTTPLTPSEVQEMLGTAKSYYPSTSVWDDAGCWQEVGYVADPKNYIDGKLSQMQAAITSLEV